MGLGWKDGIHMGPLPRHSMFPDLGFMAICGRRVGRRKKKRWIGPRVAPDGSAPASGLTGDSCCYDVVYRVGDFGGWWVEKSTARLFYPDLGFPPHVFSPHARSDQHRELPTTSSQAKSGSH